MTPENIQPFIPLALVIALALAGCIESIFPFFERRKVRWQHTFVNLGIVTIFFILSGVAGFVSSQFITASDRLEFGVIHWLNLSEVTGLISGLILCDLVNWTSHLLKHKIPFFWRFHRVHHSDAEMNATTALRNHPLEAFINMAITATGYVLLGISPVSVLLYTLILLPMLAVTHTNIALPGFFDKWASLLFVTPNFHKIHHSEVRKETDSNYGDVLSVWDRIFRTHTRKENLTDLKLGLIELSSLKSFWALIKMPFLKK